MPYIHPENVTAPRDRWQHRDPPAILHDGGEGCWSVAEGTYDEHPRLAIRWNGETGRPWGFPSRGRIPLWFIVPRGLEDTIQQAIDTITE